MHIQLNIKKARVGDQDGIYIEENLVKHGETVGRIDSSFHAWEKDGINYDVANPILPH